MPAGRPTKYTPETVDKILKAIAVGAPYTHACNYAGIGFDAFNEWRQKYPEFSEQIKEAEGKAAVGWLAKIEKAASDGNWTAAAWKLERRYPHDFGKTIHEHEGSDGGPIEIVIRHVKRTKAD